LLDPLPEARVRRLNSLLVIAFFFGASFAYAQEYVPGEVIVKLKGKGKTVQSQAFIGKAVSETGMALKQSWSGLNMHHFSLKAGQSVESAVQQLKSDPDVEYAEPNYIFHKQSDGAEQSPMSLSEINASSGSNSTFSQTSAPIEAPQGWAEATPGLPDIIVAVIDTGVDYNHEVLLNSGAIWTNPGEIAGNGIDDDHNGYIDDVHGWNFVANNNNPMDDNEHGTHVAGIILGTSQDISASPIQPAKIKIMPVKFLDHSGSGTTSDAVRAIYYAVHNGARVLNNSWGGGGFSNALLDAINYAYNQKVVFAAAAGNASSNNDASPTYPASYSVPNIVSVAATTSIDGFAGFSNYGHNSVHMGSPGSSILSSVPGDCAAFNQPPRENCFQYMSGTSMATPFSSGVLALIIRENPAMSGYEAKRILFAGTQPISSLATRTSTGGRLNVYQSVVDAKAATVDGSQPSYDASAARDPASTEMVAPACGLVAKGMYDSSGGGPAGPQKNLMFFAVLLLLVSPVLVSVALRERDGKSRRRHTRYQLDSSVTLRMGERELKGSISTISMGGVQLNTDAWLENGGVVKMSISSPDGKEQIEVEGRVVWSEEKKRYGVAFENTAEGVRSAITDWTRGLLKA
jgi:subtilisin family serine protease